MVKSRTKEKKRNKSKILGFSNATKFWHVLLLLCIFLLFLSEKTLAFYFLLVIFHCIPRWDYLYPSHVQNVLGNCIGETQARPSPDCPSGLTAKRDFFLPFPARICLSSFCFSVISWKLLINGGFLFRAFLLLRWKLRRIKFTENEDFMWEE